MAGHGRRQSAFARAAVVGLLSTAVASSTVTSVVAEPSGGVPPATIDPTTRTVETDALRIRWSLSNPEEIESVRWKGSSNLTNTMPAFGCSGGGDQEYFGNSTGTQGGDAFLFLVASGTTGTWARKDVLQIAMDSVSTGCLGSAGIPVSTTYDFFEGQPTSNKLRVEREFSFGGVPLTEDFRPYIPRLFPRDTFSQVLHPNALGTALLTELGADCNSGCLVTDWDATWFAIHDPASGRGLIVTHHGSPHQAALWVDQDRGSGTTASAVVLVAPAEGFTGTVVEVQTLCFYDASTWPTSMQAALTPPAECVPAGPFMDDDGNVFVGDIEWLAAEGITRGCNPPFNTRFCPHASVTRGQMAAFLVRALGLSARLDDPFADDDGSIFEADIERLAAAGITRGCNPPTNTRFCPNDPVTRGEMAAFLVRALGLTARLDDPFTDDDESIFEADIERLAAAGITRGCNPPDNTRFCPDDSVTRGQMAAFLHRALG